MAMRNRRRSRANQPADPLVSPPPAPISPPTPPSSSTASGQSPSIEQLKASLPSRLDSLRSDVDRTHATLVKELAAASARLSKRTKLELQSCTQHMDEVDRDSKTFASDLKEDLDEVKGDCDDFLSRAQNAAAHCKATDPLLNHDVQLTIPTSFFMEFALVAGTKKALPEIVKSFEKDMEKLRARFQTST